MPREDNSVLLLERLRAGDPDAAEVVFQRYIHRLIGLARRFLFDRARPVVGSEDVAMSALNSFLCRPQAAHDLDSEDSLWRLLAAIALNKCRKWNRHFGAQKRGAHLHRVPWPSPTDDSHNAWEAIDSALTPADGAILAETVEVLLAGLEPKVRRMCQMRLQGFQVQEIAAELDYTEEWVSRKLRIVKERLHALLDIVPE